MGIAGTMEATAVMGTTVKIAYPHQ